MPMLLAWDAFITDPYANKFGIRFRLVGTACQRAYKVIDRVDQ